MVITLGSRKAWFTCKGSVAGSILLRAAFFFFHVSLSKLNDFFVVAQRHNWGEPKRAPHKSLIRAVLIYVCMYIIAVKIVNINHVLLNSKCSSGRLKR